MSRTRSRFVSSVALAVALVMGAAACGGGDEDTAGASGDTPTTAETTTTAAPIIAPLTGVVDPTGASATRPVLTVKVENTASALPQDGIDQADVVYEEVVEGGITRLAAMFNSRVPNRIGPIRSVRNTDQAIVWPVGGVFAYSGGAPVSVRSISEAPVVLVDEDSADDGMFRDSGRQRPHNLFGNGEVLITRGGTPVPPPALFSYRAAGAPATGEPAGSFDVGFRARNAVTWTWNPAAGTYTRHVFDRDAATGAGAPIAPQNVIVQFVDYVGGKNNAGAGAEGSEAVMTGSGDAWVFTGGVVIKGRWERASKEVPTQFVDAAGASIALAPGQTWVELPQIGYTITVR
jgi:hypothetical protein